MSVLLKLERKEWQQTGASRRLQKGGPSRVETRRIAAKEALLIPIK